MFPASVISRGCPEEYSEDCGFKDWGAQEENLAGLVKL